MSDTKQKRPGPISVRVTEEQRAHLRARSGAVGMSLSGYILWQALNPGSPPPKTRNRHPVEDHKLLAQLLGALGQSRIASNLNQLARLAHSGSFPITPDTEAALRNAVSEIADMRRLLMAALGLTAKSE